MKVIVLIQEHRFKTTDKTVGKAVIRGPWQALLIKAPWRISKKNTREQQVFKQGSSNQLKLCIKRTLCAHMFKTVPVKCQYVAPQAATRKRQKTTFALIVSNT
jgi:hypothetical protein